jgi:hypothetical protein
MNGATLFRVLFWLKETVFYGFMVCHCVFSVRVGPCTNKYGFDLFVGNFGEFLGNFSGGYLRWGYFLIHFSTSK